MASLYVHGYTKFAVDRNNLPIAAPMEPPIFAAKLDVSGAHVESAAIPDTVTVLRLHADAICSRAVGVGAVATIADPRMAAGQTEYVGIQQQAGRSFIVSGILNT